MRKFLLIIGICVLTFFACKKDIELLHETIPEIVTEECTDITESSAVLNCCLTTKGSALVDYGFYYSEAPNNTPTAADKTIRSHQSSKSFSYTLTGLKENTTYYVRAYACNNVGEAIGEIVQFTTLSKKNPIMGSSSVTNVTTNSATLNGVVTSAGTEPVKERGFCLSTTKAPTITDSCITVGSGTGLFSYTLQNLEEGVTYYVRAYATSDVGTAYSDVINFTTQFIDGAIQANFSVSVTKQVYFSNGNLQYQASTNTWRFAENQWDYVGTQIQDAYNNYGGTIIGSDNNKISSTYNGWIDLFGWGTSGYNDKNPYMTSLKTNDYGDGDNDIAGTNYDWGVYNAISNGGNTKKKWRTLTQEEWVYLIYSRTDALSKYGLATVNGVNGLILLPDYWILPKGLTFVSGATGVFSQNTYSYFDWNKMESNGAVFLPAAGCRNGTFVYEVGSSGWYCSGSVGDFGVYALCVDFNIDFDNGDVQRNCYYRNKGFSVRLVQDVK